MNMTLKRVKAWPDMIPEESHKSINKSPHRNGKMIAKKCDKKPTDLTDKTASKSSRRSKTKSNSRRRERGPKREPPGVKLVLRLLPPILTKQQFLDIIQTAVGDISSWKLLRWYYVQGYYTSKIFSEPVYSRCYLVFPNIEQLEHFAKLVEPLTFVDDKDNSTKAVIKVSSYCENYDDDNRKPICGGEQLEGTLDQDIFFQNFLNSIKLMEESTEYSYAGISLLNPLEKEMNKRREVEMLIKKRSESALITLTSDIDSKDDSDTRGSKKSKRKEKKTKKTKKAQQKEKEIKAKKNKRSKKSKSTKTDNNSNVVILEAAGKKELQRRKKLKDTTTEKVKSRTKKISRKPVSLLKKEPQE